MHALPTRYDLFFQCLAGNKTSRGFFPHSARAMTTLFNLQGHRGARALHPENTLPSFEAALDAGVTSIETDVHLTARRRHRPPSRSVAPRSPLQIDSAANFVSAAVG